MAGSSVVVAAAAGCLAWVIAGGHTFATLRKCLSLHLDVLETEFS